MHGARRALTFRAARAAAVGTVKPIGGAQAHAVAEFVRNHVFTYVERIVASTAIDGHRPVRATIARREAGHAAGTAARLSYHNEAPGGDPAEGEAQA